jgi:hypothetical protein
MSAGGFFNAKYQASALNGGGIHPIRIQPETLTLEFDGNSNASPVGAVDNQIRPSVSGTKRQNGLIPRKVFIQFVNAPAGYEQGVSYGLPWLDDTSFGSISRGDVGTYSPLGTAESVVVTGKSPEYPAA